MKYLAGLLTGFLIGILLGMVLFNVPITQMIEILRGFIK